MNAHPGYGPDYGNDPRSRRYDEIQSSAGAGRGTVDSLIGLDLVEFTPSLDDGAREFKRILRIKAKLTAKIVAVYFITLIIVFFIVFMVFMAYASWIP